MPSPHSLATVLEEQRIRRGVERRLLPYGGDAAIAKTIADAHPRRPWTATCAGCGEPWQCRDRIDAERVLASASAPTRGGR